MKFLLSLTVLQVFLVSLTAGFLLGPLHASCKVKWTFSSNWNKVKTDIVNQINLWSGPDNCKNSGEKCLYILKSTSDNEIQAVHETPKKHYKDDLKFTLISDGDTSCTVQGSSSSETWYAYLDQGTNYCNLENLIVGAGLNTGSAYIEDTSNSVCTQYSSANCDVY